MASGSAYWDSVGRSFRSHHLERNVAEYKRGEHVRLLEKWCGNMAGDSAVLKTDLYEEAFGEDSFMDWLTGRSRLVHGIDVSTEITAKACQRNPQMLAVNSSVTELPFKDSSFNVVVSNSTLDHIPQKQLPTALTELSRVLRRGGVMVLTLDNAHNPLYRLGYFIGGKIGVPGYSQERCYSKGEVVPLLEDAGFSVEDVGSVVHLPTPFNMAARILSPLNSLLLDMPVKFGISFFSAFGLGGRNIYTGWFVAFRCFKR